MAELGIAAGVGEVDELLNGVDGCFALGFSRLGAEQLGALASLARVFVGTPLGERMKGAVEGLSRAEFREEHFVTVAAARAALQGAQHDALVEGACGALGYVRPELGESVSAASEGSIGVWMGSARQWLMELALAGFLQLDREHISPFHTTLEQLQAEPKTARLGMLLTGMSHEWMDSVPMSSAPVKAVRRWSDLWTRAMMSAQQLPAYGEAQPVHGDVYLLGVDLRHHSHGVSAVFHGILVPSVGQAAAPPRHVRLTASAYKVDVLDEEEVWQVLGVRYDRLVEAYTRQKVLVLKGMAMWPTGDVRWSPDHVGMGPGFDAFEVAREHLGGSKGFVIAEQEALDRHPAQVGVLYWAPEITVKKAKAGEELTMQAKGWEVALDMVRVSDSSKLAGSGMVGAVACIGLLRFDGGRWWVQPLAAKNAKGEVARTGHQITLLKRKGSTLDVLKERAGKLLRVKKS